MSQDRGDREQASRMAVGTRVKRRIRRIVIGVTILVLVACLLCVLFGVWIGRASAQVPEPGMDVVLAIDNSNSMFDKGGVGSDPELRRIEAAQLFIHYLGVDVGAALQRVGVIFFGGTAEEVVPLTSLADEARRQEIARLIAEPVRMDWTDPVAALALARQSLAATENGDRRRAVVLLTDGKPEWDEHPTYAERDAVIADLEAMAARYAEEDTRLFVILLENQVTGADVEIGEVYVPLWERLTEQTDGRFYTVQEADALIEIYHDVLLTLNGAETQGPVVDVQVTGTPKTQRVTVEPDLARVTFVVRAQGPEETSGRDTGVDVSLHRPDGRPLQAGDAGVRHTAYGSTAIWAVDDPQPGEWVVVIDGAGSVTVWKDYVVVSKPSTPTPTFTPTPTATASPIPRPTSTPTPTPMPTPQVEFVTVPSLVLLSPAEDEIWRAGREAEVLAEWNADPVPDLKSLPMTVTLAQEGEIVGAYHGMVAQGLVITAPAQSGSVTVTVRADGPLAGYPDVGITVRRRVRVRKPFPWWGVGIGVIGGATMIGGAGVYRWRRRQPRLTGKFRVLEAPVSTLAGLVIDLSDLDRREVDLGGGRLQLFIPGSSGAWGTVRALSDGSGVEFVSSGVHKVVVNEHPVSVARMLRDRDIIETEGLKVRYECL